MITTRVKWVEKKTFLGTDSRGHGVVISGPAEEPGVSAMQMLLLALGACALYDIVTILEKQRQPLRDVQAEIDGERTDGQPSPWKTIHVRFHFWGEGLDTDKVERAIQLSIEKYCGVHATLSPAATITHEYTIHP